MFILILFLDDKTYVYILEFLYIIYIEVVKMQNNFKFQINKFGPINEANININKLTVVGGFNASGKSFSSRLLFCIVTALSDEGRRIDNEAINNLFRDLIKRHNLDFSAISNNSNNSYQIANLMDSWNDYDVSYEYLNNFYTSFEDILQKDELITQELRNDLNKIEQVVDSHKNKFQYVISILNFLFINEFGLDQLGNFNGSDVKVLMNDEDTCNMEYAFHFNQDSITINMDVENQITCREFSNVIYIDSMSAMDFQLTGYRIHYHYISLYNFLTHGNSNKIGVYDNIDDLKSITNQFNGMLNGTFNFDSLNNIFSFESGGKLYDVKNIASGYKQIGVLQKLIKDNQLTGKSLLILDEPETNLHPDFQVQLANIIVQMVKKLDMMVYINSHSPFIIEALEVYSKKEGIEDYTNFYMCESITDEHNEFNIISIDRDDLKIFYDNLSNPFRVINNIRFENDLNDLD